jgi:choline transport protein
VVAPESCNRFLSYVVGWCVLLGELSVTAGCALNSADIVGTFIEIVHPDFVLKVCYFYAQPSQYTSDGILDSHI